MSQVLQCIDKPRTDKPQVDGTDKPQMDGVGKLWIDSIDKQQMKNADKPWACFCLIGFPGCSLNYKAATLTEVAVYLAILG